MGRSIRDGQHDFDFEFGAWATNLRRLKDPLAGATDWVEYEGTSVVRPIWAGRGRTWSSSTWPGPPVGSKGSTCACIDRSQVSGA